MQQILNNNNVTSIFVFAININNLYYITIVLLHDDFLRMDLPAGTSIVGFADDALVVCAADDVGILELRINESL